VVLEALKLVASGRLALSFVGATTLVRRRAVRMEVLVIEDIVCLSVNVFNEVRVWDADREGRRRKEEKGKSWAKDEILYLGTRCY
jgi:hypothetical protein